jgi:hypothetical protein
LKWILLPTLWTNGHWIIALPAALYALKPHCNSFFSFPFLQSVNKLGFLSRSNGLSLVQAVQIVSFFAFGALKEYP